MKPADVRVLRVDCNESNEGQFRVHLTETEWAVVKNSAALGEEALVALKAIHNCISYSDTMQQFVLTGLGQTGPALQKVRDVLAKAAIA